MSNIHRKSFRLILFVLSRCRGKLRCLSYTILLLTLAGPLASVSNGDEIRELSNGQKAVIYASSAAVLSLGHFVERFGSDSIAADGYKPNGVDRWFRSQLRGRRARRARPSNFLDNDLGALLTPLAAFSAISVMDFSQREFSVDASLFMAGLATTKGVTDLVKSLSGRPRPYMMGIDPQRTPDRDHFRSFFSGHTSAAFYSATFFNCRFRHYMRKNWTAEEYSWGRWLSPAISFGWASIVGYSRIQADKHYFTDVMAAVLVGALCGELYYRWGRESDGSSSAGSQSAPILMIAFRFTR
ncbi:phosphatase PAP2 family protein [Candidatus Zixiibacteriota bacterium]